MLAHTVPGWHQMQPSCFFSRITLIPWLMRKVSASIDSTHTVTTCMITLVNCSTLYMEEHQITFFSWSTWGQQAYLEPPGSEWMGNQMLYLGLGGFFEMFEWKFFPWKSWERSFSYKQFPVEMLLASLHWDVHPELHPKERPFCWAEQCGRMGKGHQLPLAG